MGTFNTAALMPLTLNYVNYPLVNYAGACRGLKLVTQVKTSMLEMSPFSTVMPTNSGR